jgi:predicted double-glycine peptidase
MKTRKDGNFNFLDEQVIFNHWNEIFRDIKEITKHKDLSSKVIKNAFGRYFTLSSIIAETLRNHSVDEIILAITAYHDILTQPGTYYTHKYSLGQFLHYGNRNGTGYVTFLNKKVKPKKTTEEVVESIRRLFKPTTEEWDKNNILDPRRQTYYGFPLPSIKNWKDRKSDLDFTINLIGKEVTLSGSDKKIIPRPAWEFSDIWSLELVMAGMIYHRKDLNQENKNDLKRYCRLWMKVLQERGKKNGP